MWWHFTLKDLSVHFELQTGTFCENGMKMKVNICGGLFQKKTQSVDFELQTGIFEDLKLK